MKALLYQLAASLPDWLADDQAVAFACALIAAAAIGGSIALMHLAMAGLL